VGDINPSLEALQEQCEDEVTRFFKEGVKNAPACYELFTLALQANNTLAFTLIYRIYEPLVKRWVVQHTSYTSTRQSVEHFVSAAYASFYASLRGNSLVNFPTVAQLLAYLKTCVNTAILQEIRAAKKQRLDDELPESTPTKIVETTTTFDELWQHICRLIPNEQDQLAMRCAFIEDRKPAEIAELYPQYWQTSRLVSITLYRIRQILRNDPGVKGLGGLDENP
jgi:hypothetical protein